MNLKLLTDILTYRRYADTDGEEAMIANIIDKIPGIQQDAVGNRYLIVNRHDGTRPRVMFSSHTDTVSRVWDGSTNQLMITEDGKFLMSDGTDVLGADDGVGIYLMMRMIKNKIPGLYVFHRGEEVGGHGSIHFAKHFETIDEYDYAIAFDRKGTTDVITHQFGGRCCSKEFANELARTLTEFCFHKFTPCEGVFTDTANYTEVIPECTNISCGYYNHHTKDEYVDLEFVETLENALMQIDWESLPVVRNPKSVDTGFEYDEPNYFALVKTITDHPDMIADMLIDNGFTQRDLDDYMDYYDYGNNRYYG